MTAPISHKLELFADPLMASRTDGSDFRLCLCGDSKTAESASTASLHFGLIRSWNHPAWSGIFARGVNGTAAYAFAGTDGNSSTSIYAARAPGATWDLGPGAVGLFPVAAREWKWSASVADGVSIGFSDLISMQRTLTITANTTTSTTVTVTFGVSHNLHTGQSITITGATANLNGTWRILNVTATTIIIITTAIPAASSGGTVTVPSSWGAGDQFSGVHMAGRAIVYKSTTAGMTAQIRLRGRRNAAQVTTSGDLTMADTDGVTYVDHLISNAAGFPGIQFETRTGYDETNKYLTVGGYGLYRHDGSGNRTPGLLVTHIAYSGWTTRHLLNALGSGTDQITVPQANTLGYLQACFSPSYWLIDIGQNAATGENAELVAGTYATYKANVAAIIAQINVLHAAMELTGSPIILLCCPYSAVSSNTAAVMASQAQALYELSKEHHNVCFLNVAALMATNLQAASSGLSWFTQDGTHPSPDGSAYWASVIWSALASTSELSNRSEEIRQFAV